MLLSLNSFPARVPAAPRNRTRYYRTASVGSRPGVNIRETDAAYELALVAPGLSREDFEISLDKNELIIRYEASDNAKAEEDRWIRREFSPLASFQRRFELNERVVDGDTIAANYRDGILYLSIPKRAEAQPQPARLIEIA